MEETEELKKMEDSAVKNEVQCEPQWRKISLRSANQTEKNEVKTRVPIPDREERTEEGEDTAAQRRTEEYREEEDEVAMCGLN